MDSSVSLENQIQKLEEKIRNKAMPAELTQKVESMISLLRASMKDNQASFLNLESVATYVNWVTSLPFDTETKDVLDLSLAKKILDKNHYGLNNVKSRILEYLASLILNLQKKDMGSSLKAPILCFVGIAGTGKTTLASSIAESLGRKFERIPFGGMGDAKNLRGLSRNNQEAEPGLVIKKLVEAGSKNPVILLDELDRVGEAVKADIMGVLIELLDPQQNSKFVDHYIDYPFDLSKVLFIATANNTTNISTAVLDRLEIIQMPSLADEEKIIIAKEYLFPKISLANGLSAQQIIIEDSVWPSVIRPLGFDSGIRSLERSIEGICRKAALLFVEKKVAGSTIRITNENIKEFLPQ